ncbi:SRPBCC family protein [Amycolatopsis regifaucium]|uniref:ATPase n=1 Tax=Amycolatopsis regifaucium TaxID=546365 RepID=A0A154M3L3_9PSEU|nr:SRPBCC family protein [Amycolatopsis regifaucium]KZB79156.1 ATPase [Amycolatopsis regifaucium]OKA07339.1 MxaD family protein [Amycolatopsis regifaucium]SFH13918.1 Polyketide cyclase / dehydrase and lipid transport [Amycolatopsis regifaucium]
MQSYDVTAESPASPAAVWALLLNARSWPVWSRVDALETTASQGLSADGRDGVGATRAFRTGKTVTKERITALEPERRFAYEGVENPAMADYRAAVELRETSGGGTQIRWHGTYRARRGMAWFFQWYLRRFMRDMATGLADHAGGPAR